MDCSDVRVSVAMSCVWVSAFWIVVLQRVSVFKWMAATALELGADRVSTHLQTMLVPVVREYTNKYIAEGLYIVLY